MKSLSDTTLLSDTYKETNIDKKLENTIQKTKKKQTKCCKNSQNLPDISYINYISHDLSLDKYKLTQLRDAAKKFKLRSSGKKQDVIERIMLFFYQTKSAIFIQKIFRSWICRYIIILRGPGFYNKNLCVNNTDFCTMEPLNEIENDYFYSFTDSNNFTYGFNITSLIEIFKRNNKTNPYNRELLSDTIIKNIVSLYNLSFILCKDFSKSNIPYIIENRRPISRNRNSFSIDYSPITRMITNMEDLARYNHIQSIRTNTIDNRISELFIEIDLLGNYTNREWFDNLDLRDYIRLYRKLYEIWYYTSELPREIQNNICPFYSPFDGIFTRPLLHSEIRLEQIKTACLIVIENMVYSGINEDFRKIGTLHALTALTMVSIDARRCLPWLYESIQS